LDYIRSKLESLAAVQPVRTAREDYDAFWAEMMKIRGELGGRGSRTAIDPELPGIRAWRVALDGWGGTRVAAWFLLPPPPAEPPHPCLVIAHGYTGSKGEPERYAAWLLRGYAVLAFDVRGQGGESGDRTGADYGAVKGWITRGILDKHACYYKAIVLDALQAIDWAAAQPEVDPGRIAMMGGSQGGGLTLLAAAYHPRVAAAVADIPNMCQMDFGIFNSTGSLAEAAEFVNRHPEHLGRVLETLSYFDAVNCADRIRCPILISVGLKDTICWPETIYAVYNGIASERREIVPFPFAGHFVPEAHGRTVSAFLRRHVPASV